MHERVGLSKKKTGLIWAFYKSLHSSSDSGKHYLWIVNITCWYQRTVCVKLTWTQNINDLLQKNGRPLIGKSFDPISQIFWPNKAICWYKQLPSPWELKLAKHNSQFKIISGVIVSIGNQTSENRQIFTRAKFDKLPCQPAWCP